MTPADYSELRLLARIDARQREQAMADCQGKTGFPTQQRAYQSMRKPGLRTYHCRHCALWHVGHSMRHRTSWIS